MIGFSWLASLESKAKGKAVLAVPEGATDLNGYLKIDGSGLVTINSPNPEIKKMVLCDPQHFAFLFKDFQHLKYWSVTVSREALSIIFTM